MSPLPVTTDSASRDTFLAWVGELARRYRGGMAGVARREGLSPEDAVDAVQEALHTFITLPEARPLVGEPEQSRRLLAALTRNVARNRRRLHAVARPHAGGEVVDGLAADAASVEEVVVAAEEHVRLQGCMRTLAEVPRAVVTLRMLEELPGDDVARTLGITARHVAVLLFRAKASLLACMSDCDGADGD